MKFNKSFVPILVALAVTFSSSFAVAQDYKGKAVIPYTPSAFSSKPSDKTKHADI